MRSLGWASPNPLGVLIKRGNVNRERQRQRGEDVETQGEDSQVPGENAAKGCWKHQELEEIRKDPPLELPEGTRHCRHLDFGLPVSKLRPCISVGGSHPRFGTLLRQPRETNRPMLPTKDWNLQRP